MDLHSTDQLFQAAIKHLEQEFGRLQAGRASASMVEGVLVLAYGSTQPLRNVATITTPDSRSLMIQPWDKSILPLIDKSLRERSDLGFNPRNSGDALIINVPQPTEERRKELVKVAHAKGEESRISIRTARQGAHVEIQRQKKDGELSEDQAKLADKKLQESVDKANAKVEELVKIKEKEIMIV